METPNAQKKKFNWKVFSLSVVLFYAIQISWAMLCIFFALGSRIEKVGGVIALVFSYYYYQLRKSKQSIKKGALFIIVYAVIITAITVSTFSRYQNNATKLENLVDQHTTINKAIADRQQTLKPCLQVNAIEEELKLADTCINEFTFMIEKIDEEKAIASQIQSIQGEEGNYFPEEYERLVQAMIVDYNAHIRYYQLVKKEDLSTSEEEEMRAITEEIERLDADWIAKKADYQTWAEKNGSQGNK